MILMQSGNLFSLIEGLGTFCIYKYAESPVKNIKLGAQIWASILLIAKKPLVVAISIGSPTWTWRKKVSLTWSSNIRTITKPLKICIE